MRMEWRIGRNLAGGILLALAGALGAGTALADGVEPAMSQTLGERASYYRAYQRDLEAIERLSLGSKKEIKEAAQLLNSFDPQRLSEGFLAHHALIAANTTSFADAVKDEAGSHERSFMSQIALDDMYLSGMPQSRDALVAVISSAADEVQRMRALGARFEAKAYELMNARTKSSSSPKNGAIERISFVPDETMLAKTRLVARGPVNRILSSAAHICMPGDRPGGAVDASLNDRDGAQCLKWAKLNLAQCLAASALPEEDAYCAGKHGLLEVSACWSAFAQGDASS
ncbi:MAG: hypothetical protein H6923_01015 [Alphaproteobacteria bacterium]|nr:hypothetical protein [Alphaproteobacteria bacterium]